ncbi:hypothetical protein IFO68_21170 [Photobacterium sp. CAU 1568]|uniref:Uncharacterized protein n=1 Tax=Photobacterium arenosum TaxID=2774143 RepID=A0ABR9BTK6_9GAMM|nr:hypothetical protein [Photobacterium arenosum]MBD8515195.1 hypothetical protein [Photobacterium arenosum]
MSSVRDNAGRVNRKRAQSARRAKSQFSDKDSYEVKVLKSTLEKYSLKDIEDFYKGYKV